MKHYLFVIAIVTALVAGTRPAAAQAQVVPDSGSIKGAEKTDVVGWAPFLTLTSTLALADNSSVVGQVDGFSTLAGLGVAAGADYVDGRHLFRSTLSLNEGVARTPVVDDYIKTTDVAKLEGLYNYFLTPNFGGFARLSFSTALFDTDDIRGVATDWVVKEPSGVGTTPLTTQGLRQHLADAFKPFSISESAGAFAEPIRQEWLNLSMRVGLGGRDTFASGVLVNADDKSTPEIELSELQDVHQLGLEGFVGATGKLNGGKANYKAGLSVLYPFVNNDNFDRTASALTRVAFEGALTFNVYAWMGLVYSVGVIRDPELFPRGQDKVSIANSLLLTFQFSVVKKPSKPKEPTKEELEIKLQKERAEAAERRAIEAEERLKKALETPPPPPPPPPAPVPDPNAPQPDPNAPTPTPAP